MLQKHLIIHISRAIGENVPEEKIREELSHDNWSPKDIDEAFYYVMYPEKIPRSFLRRLLFDTEVPFWVTFLAIVVLGVSLSFILISFRQTTYDYKITLAGVPAHKEIQFEYGVQPALSNPDYFKSVKGSFVSEGVSFIEADLVSMLLRVYKGADVVAEVRILSKGPEGTWSETPSGLYAIESKEPKHFSSFGKVYFRWAMPFHGNFFIHGWPFHPDGTPVASTYSGGCIRLSDEDAKTVYDLANPGMPVLVFEKDFTPDMQSYKLKPPQLLASAYLAVDLKSNFVFAEQDSEKVVSIASITKLVTALVATEYINLEKTITISSEVIIPTSKSRLKAGQQIITYHLLFPLLMESSNEAAEALASAVGRERFISLMNKRVQTIGMTQTHFTDPAGVDSGNMSSPHDLFLLLKYLYNNRSFILRLTAGKSVPNPYGPIVFTQLGNFNNVLEVPKFAGGKTGTSKSAQEALVSIFELNLGGEERPVGIIVLGTDDRKRDSGAILNFVKNNFAVLGATTTAVF